MKRLLTAACLLCLVASVAVADGPETGVISGQVMDASGTPLPGVTVTLEGPRGSQAAITDQDGAYRFALLPPGSYTVTAELEGFQAMKAAANVSAGRTSDVDLSLRLGTSEEITVTSEAPMVDKFNVTAGATVDAEIGEQTAGSTRTYYGVINTLPGVASDSQNADIQDTRPSVNGSNWADQQVFIDGVDTSFARYGGSRVYLPTTAVTEVTMEAGGSSAEYGRAVGSTTNVIVKSGTNTFHGDGVVTYQTVDWAAEYESHPELAQRQTFPVSPDFFKRSAAENDVDSTGYELSLGGPIVRDKAWFFIGWSDVDTNDLDKTLNGDPIDVSLNTEARIAKFNFQPGTAHQISASYIDTPADRIYFNPESFDQWTVTPHISDGELGTLNWNWSISNNLFLETKIATQESDETKYLACFTDDVESCLAEKQLDPRFPPNPAGGPHWPGNNYRVYLDTEQDSAWHNGWILDNGFGLNEFPRDQANAALTQFVGANHELRYGIDWQEVQWNSDVSRPGLYSGPNYSSFTPFGYTTALGRIGEGDCGVARTSAATVAFLNSIGIPAGLADVCLFRDYNPAGLEKGSGDSLNEDLAFYVRDRFTIGDHWTFNLGVRYENAVAENDVGREVVEADNFAPRLAAAYDIKGDGRMLATLNAGRYYAQINQQWINQHMMDEWNGYEDFDDFLFCDALDVQLGVCPGVGYNFPLRSVRSGRMWELVDQGIWDSEIDPYYKDEIILGFEWQVSNNWAIDAKGIYWELGDMMGATTQISPFGDQFKMVANYEDYPAILRAMDDVRVANGGERLFSDATLNGFEEGVMEYQALQLQFNRRFANGWALFNNVTFSETETTGAGSWDNNTNSDYGTDLHVLLTEDMLAECNARQTRPDANTGRTRTIPIDCNVLRPYLGQPVSTINYLGNSRNTDRPIIWNTFGFKSWQVGSHTLTAGGSFRYLDGLPWARTESVSVFTPDGNNAQNDSVALRVEETGARRLDGTYNLNLSFAWEFPLFREITGNLRVEGLNVTDEQDQVYVTSRGEVRQVRRDFQRPRQFRTSFTLRF